MLSLIIPCYRCSPYIRGSVAQAVAYARDNSIDMELLLVDDGSRDETPRVLRELAAEYSCVRVVLLPKNAGKGAAVQAGMAVARGSEVLFTDADLPYDLRAIPAFVSALRRGADVVLGTREWPAGETPEGQETHRTLLSGIFATLANFALRAKVSDTQCGFKGFTKHAADLIFPELTVFRFCFDVEMIAIAQLRHLRIVSLPVVLVNQAPSTVRVTRDGLQMLTDLLRIWWKRRVRGVVS